MTYKNGMRNLVPNILKGILLLILCAAILASENLEQKLHHIGEEAHISICITFKGDLTILSLFFHYSFTSKQICRKRKTELKESLGLLFHLN